VTSPRYSQPPDPMIGSTLAGKYKIIKKLGEGGMGSVYQAQQQPIERMVAVKVLLGKLAQDEVAVKRFEQEARAVSRMQHPNTVTIFDYGKTEDERLYIVMEYLRGRTLSEALRQTQGAGLDARRAIHVTRQVAASLHDAHAAGIIHRDLKPDNIFLTEMGGTKDFVKVLDFGVAKMADDGNAGTLTQTGMIFGTPKYMSPEQAEGKPIDFRADIYAIGVVLYEMLVGRPPFLADTPVALLLKHISEPPAPFRRLRPDLQVLPELEAVTMRALEKSPDRRYLTVSELVADLDRCLALTETSAVRVYEPSGVSLPPSQRVPTEVNPPQGQLGSLTPGDLRPPSAVPSGISFPVQDIRRLPTEPAASAAAVAQPVTTGVPGVPNELIATPHGASGSGGYGGPSTGLTALPNATALSTTKPIPIGGAAEPSGAVQAPVAPSRVGLYAGSIAATAAVGAVLLFALPRGDEARVVSKPLTPSAAPDPVEVSPSASPSVSSGASPATSAAPKASNGASAPTAPSGPPREAAPHARASPPAPAPTGSPKAERVTIRFESAPAGAVVESADGHQLGVTPVAKEYLKSDGVEQVRFLREGYQVRVETFTLRADRTLAVELEKKADVAPVATPSPVVVPLARPGEVVKRVPERPKLTPAPTPATIDEKVDDLK
jgi:serine/threonine protein kinase